MSEKKKPVVRFAGFTSDWEQRKVGDYCDMFNGDRSVKYPSAQDMVADGIPFINAGDLEDGRVKLSSANKITREKYDDLGGAKLQLGDIVYCLRGTLGKNAYIDNFDEGTVASSLVAIRPKNIDGRYLFHVFNSDIEYRQRVVHDEGAAQPNLSAKSVSEFLMPVPDIDEQKKLSSFFDHLNHLITLHQRKCDKLKNVKKSMLEKMFPKNGRKVSEIRFAGFTDNWEQRNDNEELEIRSEEWYIVSIGDIVSIGNGKDYKHLSDGNIPVYGTGGYMLSVSEALSYDDAIGIGRKGTIDRPYVLKAPYWTVDTLFYCIPQNNIDLNFIYAVFQTIDWKKLDESTGVPSLSKENIANYSLLIPRSVDIQRKIGRFFKNFDKLITLHQRKLAKLQNIKKSCLEKMFV